MKSVTQKLGTFALVACMLAACGGGGGGGGSTPITPTPTPTPTATPTPPPLNTAVCVPNGQSTVRAPESISGGVVGPDGIVRVMPGRATSAYVPGQLAVQYRASQGDAVTRTLLSVAKNGNPNTLADLRFSRSDIATRVVHVDDSQLDATAATLRQQPGVLRVDRVGVRHEMTANPFFANDPYFDGHNASPAGQPGAPLYTSPTYPGQWDMHIMGLENVFGYSQAGNAVPANPNALGSGTIKIAVIDTGMDTTLADIAGPGGTRIKRTECYITPNSGPQTNTQNVADFDGHGTNVTGIAAAEVNNGFGFVGTGGNVSLLLYRIFPKGGPNDGNASSVDEASAINDAVANGANVISLSLGSSSPDPTEQTAITNAINAGVVVVAAAGNETSTKLDYPAGYAGVIAVGATGIDDTGAEHVAGYSNYDSTNASTWGLVAPGGDPSGGSDSDFLHWIENAYSLRVAAPNNCRAAQGLPDFFGESGNCAVLIAGTSQATPHVAGAVAMLLSVQPSLMTGTSTTAANVKTALFAATHDIADPKEGAGRLNEYYLIAKALGDASLPPK